MANKRAQAALEYLMTYGWALVVIIIVTAALFSLGILSPTTYQGATCRGFGKIAYFDHAYESNGTFTITLGNGSGEHISTGNATVGIDCDLDGVNEGSASSTSKWFGSKKYTFQMASGCSVTAGSKYSVDVDINFMPDNRLSQAETAVCTGIIK